MDDIRIGSLGVVDLPSGQTKGDPKKRSKARHVESEDGPMDQVTLHSTGETEETSDEDGE